MIKAINEYISIKNNGKSGIAEIDIYGEITSEKVWDEDVTPNEIKKILNDLKNIKTLELHISSSGGDVFVGNTIFDIIDMYKKKNNVRVETYIEGIAASMASGIACVGDKIYAAENSLIMVHKPMSLAYGNTKDLEKSIELLNKAENTLVKNYMRHYNGTEDELKKLLENETWMSAEEAKECGLVDEIIEPIQIAACANGIKIGDKVFSDEIANKIKNKYPVNMIEKGENKLVYDESLKEFGIDKAMFDSWGETDILINIAHTVADNVRPVTAELSNVPDKQFVDKSKALEALSVEDISGDEIIALAKAGKNAPSNIVELQNKASEYDNLVVATKGEALKSALKAKGEAYNEDIFTKMLDKLNYSEICEMKNLWDNEAKTKLNAGNRVSVPDSNVENKRFTKPVDVNDYKF